MLSIHHKSQYLLALLLCLAASLAVAEPEIDKPAPAFSGKTAHGETINLASLKGKTVVLEWTNHECPFVRKHYETGNIPQLQKQATASGVVWLQVISSARGKEGFVDGPTAERLNVERGAAPSGAILDSDGSIGRLYEAKTSPHLYIIDPAGVLVYKGGIDSIPSADKEDIAKAENYIKSALAELSSGKKISKSSTKPYGCTVKYAS